MTDRPETIDPILASVIARRLKSITEEMGLALLRTTRSPILNEARDFVTGLYDANGDMLEQTEYIPVLAFALQPVCKRIIDFFGDDIHPGDVILHNDVFSGGNQNNDVAAFRPVFHGDALIAWAACKGHQADIGGAQAGGYNPDAREVWQEALRIPPLKVYDRGVLRKDVWGMVFANIRYRIVEEDIKAQIGGARVGERGIRDLIDRYGLERFLAHKDYLFDSTEAIVAGEIGAIPDGRYEATSTVFYDGVTDGSTMEIQLAVTVDGGTVTFDFTGSSPQTPGFVNAPYAATASAVMLTFPDADRSGYPAQCRHPAAGPDRQSRGQLPQRRLPGRHDLRQFDHRADLRRDHEGFRPGDSRNRDRRLEPLSRLCRHRRRPAQGPAPTPISCSWRSRAAPARPAAPTATTISG